MEIRDICPHYLLIVIFNYYNLRYIWSGDTIFSKNHTLTIDKCNISIFGGASLRDTGLNLFWLYLELDSPNFGVPIVNFDYIQNSRLNGVGFRAIGGIFSSLFLLISSRGH